MRSLHQKTTVVPGAQRVFDGFGVPMFDKKGRCVWEMPRPTSVVMHSKWSFKGKGKTKVVMKEIVEVPVYRGLDARLARNYRSELRRKRRKELEKEVTGAHKIEIPEDLIEEVTDDNDR